MVFKCVQQEQGRRKDAEDKDTLVEKPEGERNQARGPGVLILQGVQGVSFPLPPSIIPLKLIAFR